MGSEGFTSEVSGLSHSTGEPRTTESGKVGCPQKRTLIPLICDEVESDLSLPKPSHKGCFLLPQGINKVEWKKV